jgi:hypothetical protein
MQHIYRPISRLGSISLSTMVVLFELLPAAGLRSRAVRKASLRRNNIPKTTPTRIIAMKTQTWRKGGLIHS